MFTVGAEMEQRLLYIYSHLFGRLFSHPTSTMPHVRADEKKREANVEDRNNKSTKNRSWKILRINCGRRAESVSGIAAAVCRRPAHVLDRDVMQGMRMDFVLIKKCFIDRCR